MTLQYQLAYTMQGFNYYIVALLTIGLLFVVLPKVLRAKKINNMLRIVAMPIYIMSIAGLVTGVLAGYIGSYDLSMKLYMLALGGVSCGAILLIFYSAKDKLKTVSQLAILSLWLSIWYGCAVISNITIKEYPSFVYVGLVAVLLNLVLWIKKLYEHKDWLINKSFIAGLTQDIGGLVILVVLTVIMSIIFVWKLPFLWDAADYFADLLSAARWEFTLGNVTRMDLFAHHSAGYVFLTLPGIWFFKDSFIGIHVIQTLILCITEILFWAIIRRKFDNIDSVERTLITALFISYPAVFGLSSGYNLDFGLLCLIVWVIYAWEYELDILKIVFGFLLCTTKEPAIVLYAGFAFGMWLYKVCRAGQKRNRIFTCMPLVDWMALSLPLIWWLLIDRLVGMNANYNDKWNRAGFKWLGYLPQINTVPHNFGLSIKYIVIQLIHEFVFNFEWVIVLLILGMTIYMLVAKKEASKLLDIEQILSFGCGIILFTVFHWIYITHPHYRYVASIFPLLLLILADLISKGVARRAIRLSLFGVLTLIMLLQTFRCIDPFTIINGHKVSTGSSFIVNYDVLGNDARNYKINDYSLYNLQGNQYGGVLNKAFENMNMENTLVIVADDGGDLMYCATGGRTTEDGHALGYNSRTKMFSPVKADGYTNCALGILDEKTGEIEIHSDSTDAATFDNIYYINPTFSTIDDVELVLKNADFNILDKADYSYLGGWNLEVYTLEVSEN